MSGCLWSIVVAHKCRRQNDSHHVTKLKCSIKNSLCLVWSHLYIAGNMLLSMEIMFETWSGGFVACRLFMGFSTCHSEQILSPFPRHYYPYHLPAMSEHLQCNGNVCMTLRYINFQFYAILFFKITSGIPFMTFSEYIITKVTLVFIA